ncbi:MAG: sugar phosphate nucleotidyltransferase [Clostridiales bacterium]|nr:sugar phosphate nucleotidyltransferase [Clostridiales bacterium]MDY5513185.1 sugar phosphate nucleotidyltransferase [Candidatus Ventricola sp.]
MNIILLSGGSGKRLWPLSNEIRSKQFIKIFRREDGSYESMVQRVYRQIKSVDAQATVTIATSRTQVSAIHNQLGDEVGISVEPCRRDTFPAITLATAYLVDVMHVDPSESVVVCPVDPYVEDDYFEALKALSAQADKGEANLVLMGIEPTYPSEKYGYILPESAGSVAMVRSFKEKPDAQAAAQYIAQGALWNGGVFACKPSYVLKKAHELMDFAGYDDLFARYDTLQKISFDYAVVEHEPKIQVVRFAGTWKDLGTWNTLTEAMEENIVGKGVLSDTCSGVHIVNEMDVPVLAMGLHDVVISASPEGILVSDKEQSSYIKPFVDGFEQQVMFAEKSWGSFRVIDVESRSLTIKVTLNAGHSMNYHSHQNRDEVWVVISGRGRTLVDGVEQEVRTGDVIRMPAGCRHTVMAETELKLIEVQIGSDINVHDKQKHAMECKWRAEGQE